MNIQRRVDRGLIRTILLVIVALIILGYLGFNIRTIINSPTVHDNLSYAWDTVVYAWNNYLHDPVAWLWHVITGRLEQLFNISQHIQT